MLVHHISPLGTAQQFLDSAQSIPPTKQNKRGEPEIALGRSAATTHTGGIAAITVPKPNTR